MDEKLKELREIADALRSKRVERQQMRNKCKQWNWWARQQPEYFTWAYEQALTAKDLRSYENIGEPVIYEWDEGAAYYAHKHLIHRDLEQLWLREYNLLKYLWEATNKYGRYVYNLTEIAEAHKSTETYMYRRIRRMGFAPRNDIPGRKTHNRHLKVVKNEN